ncbi:formin-like protein 20 [Amphibalanus amphitrite]|uniref:formin-like protein 20 n=1 Tax=Amphibalanus amphitrite TaxID=1232801 RepID=UPI001C918181|nr:formin-like protein 20 [Amphibalanus amphitrite]
MYRGRGAGGRGGRPFPLRGVRPVQMKPGRGRPVGPPGFSPSRGPRPLLEPGWAPRPPPPPHMMRGMGPRPPPAPYASPMRGRGGPPRGRGAPPRGRGAPPASPAARGFSSSRSRGATRGRGRGAGKTQTTFKNDIKSSKNEKQRDEIALSRPWINDTLRAEIKKKSELQAISMKSKSEKDFEAFKEQRNKVGNMLRAAKLEYIGMQEEEDVDKIMADARQKTKESMTETKGEVKTENGNGTSDAAPAAEATANGEAAADAPVKTEPTAEAAAV